MSDTLGTYSQQEADQTIGSVKWTLFPGVLIYRHGRLACAESLEFSHVQKLAEAGWSVLLDRWEFNRGVEAWKEFASEEAGIAEWEKLTGRDQHDTGCDQCGPPHEFQWLSEDE